MGSTQALGLSRNLGDACLLAYVLGYPFGGLFIDTLFPLHLGINLGAEKPYQQNSYCNLPVARGGSLGCCNPPTPLFFLKKKSCFCHLGRKLNSPMTGAGYGYVCLKSEVYFVRGCMENLVGFDEF